MPQTLLTTPLDARATPMLVDALAAVFELLRSCDLDPRVVLGAGSAEALLRRHPHLQALVEDGVLPRPMLDAALADLRLNGNPKELSPAEVIDRFLVAPVLLGVCRLTRTARPEPAWLADGVAALVAVEAYHPLLDPAEAPDTLLEGPGCHTDPRLGRLLPPARLLATRLGFEAVVDAFAGQANLADALDGDVLAAAEALSRPGAGSGLDLDAGPFDDQDAAWLEDVVLALCHRRRTQGGWPRTLPVVPEGGGLQIDLQQGLIRHLHLQSTLGQQVAEGWLDARIDSLPAPPRACAALRNAGWPALAVRIEHLEALDDLLDVLIDVCEDGAPPEPVDGEGFVVRPVGHVTHPAPHPAPAGA